MTAITAVVCSLDRRESLLATLASLGAQEAPVAWEVVVVDNGSSDGTFAAVEALASRFPAPLTVVREEQRGLSRARNRGLAAARGAAVLFLDDDMRARPGWLAAHAAAFADATLAGTGGRIVPVLPAGTPDWFLALMEREVGGPSGRYELGDEARDIRPGGELPTPFGGNMGVRRALALELGGFDTQLGWGRRRVPCEELEFFQRVFAAGGRVAYVPDAVLEHLVQPEHTTWEYYRAWQRGSGRASVIMKPPRGLGDRVGKSLTAARNATRWWLRARVRGLRGDALGDVLARRECARLTGRLLELLAAPADARRGPRAPGARPGPPG